MLAPFAPHAAEHLWVTLLESSGRGAYAPGGGADADTVHAQPWPMVDDKALAATRVPPVGVMVNGRTRCVVELDQAAARPTKDDIVRIVRADARVLAALKGASVAREIVVLPGEGSKADAKCIVNLVLTSAR
jgi:leucyl-tRNA synthetase